MTQSQSDTFTRSDAAAIANSLSEVTNLINRSLDLIPDTPVGKSVVESLGEASQDTGNAGQVVQSAHAGCGRRR